MQVLRLIILSLLGFSLAAFTINPKKNTAGRMAGYSVEDTAGRSDEQSVGHLEERSAEQSVDDSVQQVAMQDPGRLRVEGRQIVNNQGNFIIKSIGTGNWMIQEGYMMQSSGAGVINHTQFRRKLEGIMGVEKTAEFYRHWLDHHMTRADVDSMKAWGFNAIRPALHYKWFTLPIEEEPVAGEQTWIDTGFEKLDELMEWAAANEMYVMLDMHGAPGGQGKNASINDYDENLPGLFESEANKDKLVALWVKLAERYNDNPWFGGYDFINEPNWKLGDTGNPNGCGTENNDELWDLHLRLTNAVRAVDPYNIIYISGNCWGNNYSSFEDHPLSTYDEQTVITFHKYWNVNDQEAIQWAVDMRERYNRPLWMSESGENSNQWFADAIHLFESNNIGWSWWPVKKSRLNNVLKVTTPESYRRLMASWEEGEEGQPLGAEETYQAVMDYSEAHHHEKNTVAPDVIYALIHNEDPSATRPFKPHTTVEWIAFADYDLGRDGFAYHDKLSQDIHDEAGRWKVWNMGRQYRNDGVDIGVDGERTEQGSFSGTEHPYYVGWTEAGEWLQYTLQVPEGGNYDLEILSDGDAGRVQISLDGGLGQGEAGWADVASVILPRVDGGSAGSTGGAVDTGAVNADAVDTGVDGAGANGAGANGAGVGIAGTNGAGADGAGRTMGDEATRWQTTTIPGIDLPEGEIRIRFTITDSGTERKTEDGTENGPDLKAFRFVP